MVEDALVVRDENRSLLDFNPVDMVSEATKMANVLKDVIDKQKLFVDLNGNKHVKAEGWSTLGTMLAILPKEDRVVKDKDGNFEAYVSLINNRTGHTVGGGSGYVGVDEKNWKNKPEYARRSMAITRATSKAYKTSFSWIIALAGYNSTPAEEMDCVEQVRKQQQKSAGYDPNNFKHVEWLEAQCEAAGLLAFAKEIEKDLIGKDGKVLPQIIKKYKDKAMEEMPL